MEAVSKTVTTKEHLLFKYESEEEKKEHYFDMIMKGYTEELIFTDLGGIYGQYCKITSNIRNKY